jgi:hypothetical protein
VEQNASDKTHQEITIHSFLRSCVPFGVQGTVGEIIISASISFNHDLFVCSFAIACMPDGTPPTTTLTDLPVLL